MEKGLLMIISGPSAVGKGTVCRQLCRDNSWFYYSISATTRPPRTGEVDGMDYFFYTKDYFFQLKEKGAFLEWARVYDHYYGTPRQQVIEKLEQGYSVILEIDTQGAMQVKQNYKEGVFVFMLPPGMNILSLRIRERGADSSEQMEKRHAAALNELKEVWNYDYLVVNEQGKVGAAVEAIKSIFLAEKSRVKRNKALLSRLFKEGEQIALSLHRRNLEKG